MKVKHIHIVGFKAIESLSKDIDGNIIISGENGKGKSSVMQWIELCLGRTNNIPPEATGEGYVVADKDGNEYTFYLKFKDGKPQLRIKTPDGLSDDRKGSIAKIVGAIQFDINEFLTQSRSEAGRKKQVETFKKLLLPEVQEGIAKFEANAQTYYNERTEINRKLADTKGAIAKHRLLGKELKKFTAVDTGSVLAKLNEAVKFNLSLIEIQSRLNTRIERKKELKGDAINSMGLISQIAKQIEELKNKIAEYNLEIISINETNEKATEYLKKNVPVDTSVLEEQITNADKSNSDFKDAQELIKMQTEEVALTNAAGDKTVALESERQAIKDSIKDMSNPVPGLSYDDDVLYYQGIPVHPDSLAFSKIIELGVKMRIAENPDLPLFIPNGESLGTDILRELITIAKENGLQIFMEQFKRDQETLELEVMGDFEPVNGVKTGILNKKGAEIKEGDIIDLPPTQAKKPVKTELDF